MAFCEIHDINYKILEYLSLKYLLKCMIINKNSYQLIHQTSIYRERVEEIIRFAAKHGDIAMLELLISKFEFRYNEHAINAAAINGNIAVLDWFNKNSTSGRQLEFKYTTYIIIIACYYNVDVREWFAIARPEFKYDQFLIYTPRLADNIWRDEDFYYQSYEL